VAGVALQTAAHSGPVNVVGVVLAAISWLVFTADAAVMVWISPHPARWAREHRFDLLLLFATFPLWPFLLERLLVLELLPALTVLEAAKLAKLAKVSRVLRQRASGQQAGRVVAAVVLLAAAILAIVVLTG
jgi:hypothetical protein